MDTDRKRTSKSKRYELGYHLAIDWCKVPYILMILVSIFLISAVAATAYQNNTDNRENVIVSNSYTNKIVQKLVSNRKDIETDPNLDPSVVSSNLTSGLSDYFKTNSSFNSSKVDDKSDGSTIFNLLNVDDDQNVITTTEILDNSESNTEFNIEYNTEFNTEYNTEFNTEIHTTIIDEEFKSVTEIFTEFPVISEDITTMNIQNEKEYSIDNISSLDSSDRNISNPKRQLETKSFNETKILSSTTLKNIVHEIQKQVNQSLNDSLHSNENAIEDSYVITNLTFSDKKSNGTETPKKNYERKTEALKDGNHTVTESVLNMEKVQNNTENTNSSKSLMEEDYNASYEMEDYDEDKIFSMKKSVTEAPSSGPLDAIREFAGSVVETVYENFMPKGLKDLFRRMQEQNEKLETIRLRSKEENGGIGQLGRSIIKGITVPINQLMRGVRDYGSLDSDKNFFAGVASGVVSMADSVGDSFKDRVRAIFPGTLWCGDGDMARSAEVGIFFMTDSCCRRHDACKMYILSGETKFGLTNTGLFTRSHCECDKAFYRCLKRTNSLVSSQIGLTYFSILGPQCFKRDHPIMRCKRRTRITNQKCEEYEMDYDQPKVWQWFDNETF